LSFLASHSSLAMVHPVDGGHKLFSYRDCQAVSG
jgi:hypothetical protein